MVQLPLLQHRSLQQNIIRGVWLYYCGVSENRGACTEDDLGPAHFPPAFQTTHCCFLVTMWPQLESLNLMSILTMLQLFIHQTITCRPLLGILTNLKTYTDTIKKHRLIGNHSLFLFLKAIDVPLKSSRPFFFFFKLHVQPLIIISYISYCDIISCSLLYYCRL